MAALGPKSLPQDAFWIQGGDLSVYTLDTKPFEILLQANFDEVLSVASDYSSTTAEDQLAESNQIHELDLITFTGSGGYAHSGIARRSSDGKSWWIENKFEEGPILDMPIASVHDVIPNLYSTIKVYRKK